ncbi:MAG: YIP1 family protein [Bacilli bacterium]|nr:YIP1 family protein [Bacilli bacterium]
MSRFCEKCGKQLEDGEVCNCSESSNLANNSIINNSITDNSNDNNSNHELNNNQLNNNNSNIINNSSSNNTVNTIIDIAKNLFIKPFDVLANNITENNFIIGIVLIVAASFAKGLQNLLGAYRSYSKIGSFGVNYFDKFFRVFGLSLVNYAAIIAAIYVLINIIFKDKTSWKRIVVALGMSVVVTIIGNLVYCVLSFSDADIVINIISYISSFISVFSIIILYEALKGITTFDKNKLLVSLPVVYVFASIVVDIVNKVIS